MPQPAQVTTLAERLLAVYLDADTRIARLEQAVLDDWYSLRRTERLARLRELRATVNRLADHADEQALRWLQRDLPQAYLLGAAAAGTGAVAWTVTDVDAISAIAAETYDGLLSATRFVRDSTKELIRTLGREYAAAKLTTGQTATQAGKELAERLSGERIAAVMYRNGARHGIGDYTDMLVRTKTAEAYTTATLNQLDAHQVTFVEVFDGSDCGLVSHDDPDKPNGTVRPLEVMRQYVLSHPRCRRSVAGRPDVSSAREARRAAPSTTAGQREDQAAAEVARALSPAARRAGRFVDAGLRVRSPAAARAIARQAARRTTATRAS